MIENRWQKSISIEKYNEKDDLFFNYLTLMLLISNDKTHDEKVETIILDNKNEEYKENDEFYIEDSD